MADWDKITTKGRVDDRRSLGPGAVSALGGSGLIGVLLLLGVTLLGGGTIDLNQVLSGLEQIQVPTQSSEDLKKYEGDDEYQKFTEAVIGSSNDMWSQVFNKMGKTYQVPELVLFRGQTTSACGGASAAIGPHYCPYDGTIYFDETFSDELVNRFGAQGGDVAEAYIISHEVGHHVQNLLGEIDSISSGGKTNSESVALELQADCFAGLWANSVNSLGVFGDGEINEALDAAAAVGDDRIQETSGGRVDPESWTHGSSEQRRDWFNKGYQTGDLASCDLQL